MKRPLLISVLALTLLGAPFQPRCASSSGIRVLVEGLRDNRGRVGCGLFYGPDGFPREETKAFRTVWVEKHGNEAVCDFLGVPAGTYAATVLDDSNTNGKMDFNFIGLPKKGYGFSNDAKATLSPPSFKAASFNYTGDDLLTVTIHAVYWTH